GGGTCRRSPTRSLRPAASPPHGSPPRPAGPRRCRRRLLQREPSTEPAGLDELAGLRDRGRADGSRALPLVEALRDRQDRVERVPLGAEQLPAALLAVDQDDEVLDDQARLLEHLDRLELAATVRDDVVDQDHAVAGREDTLDAALRAVALLLFSGVYERQVAGEGGGDRERQARVRDAGDAVARAAAHLGGHEDADPAQHVGVAD